jgi:hypothetical protein
VDSKEVLKWHYGRRGVLERCKRLFRLRAKNEFWDVLKGELAGV